MVARTIILTFVRASDNMIKPKMENLPMSKAHDPEAQPQMETVFDCCGTIKITYPAALEDQLRDGIANATAVPNTNLKQFTLTVGGENLLDIDLTWNPNPPGAS